MRAILFVGLCFILSGCMKEADLGRLLSFTRVEISQSDSPDSMFPPDAGREKALAVKVFIEGRRLGWTRAFGGGFGPPSPVYYAHLHNGSRYVGYFAVGASVVPGSAAFFQIRYDDVFAQKRISRAEANRFLDLIGVGGELR